MIHTAIHTIYINHTNSNQIDINNYYKSNVFKFLLLSFQKQLLILVMHLLSKIFDVYRAATIDIELVKLAHDARYGLLVYFLWCTACRF